MCTKAEVSFLEIYYLQIEIMYELASYEVVKRFVFQQF